MLRDYRYFFTMNLLDGAASHSAFCKADSQQTMPETEQGCQQAAVSLNLDFKVYNPVDVGIDAATVSDYPMCYFTGDPDGNQFVYFYPDGKTDSSTATLPGKTFEWDSAMTQGDILDVTDVLFAVCSKPAGDGGDCDVAGYCTTDCQPFAYCATAPDADCANAPPDCEARCAGCAGDGGDTTTPTPAGGALEL